MQEEGTAPKTARTKRADVGVRQDRVVVKPLSRAG